MGSPIVPSLTNPTYIGTAAGIQGEPFLGLAMALGRRPRRYRLKKIAGVFKVGHYSSIAVAIRQFQDKIRADQGLANALTTITRGLVEG